MMICAVCALGHTMLLMHSNQHVLFSIFTLSYLLSQENDKRGNEIDSRAG